MRATATVEEWVVNDDNEIASPPHVSVSGEETMLIGSENARVMNLPTY
jgi:hypothetical protein